MERKKYNYEEKERIIEATKMLNDLFFIMTHMGRRESTQYKYDGFKEAVEILGFNVHLDVKTGEHTITRKER